ncbi:hypothetical protein K502DRAFT_326596 [Neoconidiobolus thromboides FSU 785]|nr:hypothetical protein K502DRAFT_326596 [Neoconidiobolus thromboides FSU 785]
MMQDSPLYNFLYKDFYPISSLISVSLSGSIIIVMASLALYKKTLVDRVSLRLQIAISFYDIWLHTMPFWSREIKDAGTMCTFLGWQQAFFPLVYTLINAIIGINLQIAFLHRIDITRNIEILYWILPIVIGLTITAPLLALGHFGFGKYDRCYISGNDIDFAKKLDFFIVQLPLMISIVYLLIVVCFVLLKLRKGVLTTKKMLFVADSGSYNSALRYVKQFGYRL